MDLVAFHKNKENPTLCIRKYKQVHTSTSMRGYSVKGKKTDEQKSLIAFLTLLMEMKMK